MTNERVDLLRLAADDCEAEANNQLREAPNLGPTKEQRNRMDAANIMKRVAALRLWADEMERSVEPQAERKPAATAAGLEDVPFLPINPEVLQAFSKQMVDWGVVWVKYGPDGVKVIPHEEIYESPPNRPAEPT